MADFTPTGLDLQLKGLSNFLSGLGRVDKGVQKTGDRLRDSKGRFIAAGKGADKFGKSVGGALPNVNRFGVALPSIGGGLAKIATIAGGAALVGIGALGAGVAAAGVSAVKTAISFESAFAGVTKTVDGLTSGIGQLNDAGRELREGFVNLTKEVPLAFEELAAIGELGGQLGIPKEALLDFTETVAALGVSTNLATEEAGAGLARMSNIFAVEPDKMGKNIEQLGSTIVALGNNFATTERDILAFGERIAGAGNIAGLTQADVLSIGAAMSSVGVAAEAGGTATQKVLLAINNAVVGAKTGFTDYTKEIDKNVGKLTKLNAESARLEATFPGLQDELLAQKEAFIAAGGSAEDFGRQLGDKTRQKALEVAEGIQTLQAETDLLRQQHGQPVDSKMLSTFAKTAELSATEFQELWNKDASEAFRLFVEGLGKQGDDAINTLSELGLQDQRLIRSFLSLSGAGDLLARTLDLGNTSFEENNALANEAAQRYATTESQIALLKNTLRAVGDTLGQQFLPLLNQGLQAGRKWIDEFGIPLANTLQSRVIPAIGQMISSVQSVFTLFSAFGAAGAATGIMGMLGLDPSTIGMVNAAIQSLQNSFTTALPFIQAAIQTTGAIISAVASTIVSIFQGSVAPALQSAFANITMALASLGISWSDVWEAIKVATGLVAAGIGAILLALVATVTGLIAGIASAIEVGSQAFVNLVGFLEQALTGAIQLILAFKEVWVGIFTGDLPRVLAGFELGLSGLVNFVSGIFGSLVSIIGGGLTAAITFIETFVTTVIDFFTGLSNTLVGNSIIPDMVNAIISTFSGMIEPILNVFSTLGETIGGLLGGLFGGGESEGPSFAFDPAEALAGVELVQLGIDTLNQSLNNITLITLPLLSETFLVVTTMMLEQLMILLETGIMPVDLALIAIHSVTLPTLQAVTIAVAASSVAAYITVQNILNILIQLMTRLTDLTTKFGEAANQAGIKAAEGFKKAADRLKSDLIPAMEQAKSVAEALAAALERVKNAATRAGNASGNRTGAGFAQGIGFQAGTPSNTGGALGLGFKIPEGFPNDSFGPMFAQSGEEMLITPRGMSIESLIFSRLADVLGNRVQDRPVVTNITNNWNIEVNSGESSGSVVRTLGVMRGFLGD